MLRNLNAPPAINKWLIHWYSKNAPKDIPGIEEQIKQVIVDKLGVDESEIAPEASFTGDLGTDSPDVFELVIEVENVFHKAISAN